MKQRRSYEAGHIPKFLIVADDSPEFGVALLFAARRAARTGARLAAIAVVERQEAQAWLGVGDILQQEAEEAASTLLEDAATRAKVTANIDLERVLRTGDRAVEVRKFIEEDEDVAVLVLGAGTSAEGPGPLVSALLGGGSGGFPVPVTIVPGALSATDIEALA